MRNRTNYNVVKASRPLARELVKTALNEVGQNVNKPTLDLLTRSVYNGLRREARKEKIIV